MSATTDELPLSLVKVGKVSSIVDRLVVVEAIKSMPPLDLDTLLFKYDGLLVGQIYDVFGAVVEPHYSLKMSKDEILLKRIQPGLDIYFSAQADVKTTKFAFVDELMRIKGTDAGADDDSSDEDESQPDEVHY